MWGCPDSIPPCAAGCVGCPELHGRIIHIGRKGRGIIGNGGGVRGIGEGRRRGGGGAGRERTTGGAACARGGGGGGGAGEHPGAGGGEERRKKKRGGRGKRERKERRGRPKRFERSTPAFGGQYSIQLSYGRAGAAILQSAPVRVQSIDAAMVSVEKGSRSLETLGVVAIAQAVDAYAPTGRRCVNESRIAQIDADMGERLVAGVEENQVAGPQ